MAVTIKLTLQGNEYEAKVTPWDGMFFLAFQLPNLYKFINEEEGLIQGFDDYSQDKDIIEARKLLGSNSTDSEISKKISAVWAERIFTRLSFNFELKAMYIDRVLECIPDISKDLFELVRYTQSGRTYVPRAHIGMSMDEMILQLTTPIIRAGIGQMPDPEEEMPTPEPMPAAVEKTSKTEAELGEPKRRGRKPKGEGFALAPAETTEAAPIATRRGRKPKAESDGAVAVAPVIETPAPAAKRGRKPKATV